MSVELMERKAIGPVPPAPLVAATRIKERRPQKAGVQFMKGE
jgi:hypothetical protein